TYVVNDSNVTDTTRTVTALAHLTKYFWRVSAYNTGGYGTFSTIDSFTTIIAVPAAPTVLFPGNGSAGESVSPLVFEWNTSSTATKYLFQLSGNNTFSTYVVNDSNVTDTTRTVYALAYLTKYFWRVSAYNAGGYGTFSTIDSFTTEAAPPPPPVPPASPTALLPANNSTFQRADTLVFKWNTSSTATKYLFQLSGNNTFSTYVVNDSNVIDTTRTVTALAHLTKYFWRVSAYNTAGYSAFSAVDSFVTIIAIPAPPALVSPIGTTGQPRRATLRWNPSTNASKYHLQISSDSAFSTVVFDTTMVDTSMKLSGPLAATMKYYWHVSAIDTGGTGNYSTTANFSTGTGIDAVDEFAGIPKEFALFQNYPNPFNPSTIIRYDLPKSAHVKVTIYDVLGRVVANLVDGMQAPSRYNIEWNSSELSSGIYFCRIQAQSEDGSSKFSSVKKLLYLK
ncbi:MAG: T9SS type A sorting domain-containing protein, partial [Candidatus Kryptoniota bacterium]